MTDDERLWREFKAKHFPACEPKYEPVNDFVEEPFVRVVFVPRFESKARVVRPAPKRVYRVPTPEDVERARARQLRKEFLANEGWIDHPTCTLGGASIPPGLSHLLEYKPFSELWADGFEAL